MRVIVCGSRDWTDKRCVATTISGLLHEGYVHTGNAGLTIVHGHCPTGADAIADEACRRFPPVDVERHPADWARHGRAGGPIRNQKMADAGADLCVAFATGWWADPISRGTKDMVARANSAGIPVWVIRSTPPVPTIADEPGCTPAAGQTTTTQEVDVTHTHHTTSRGGPA